jgi:hypothetical protein
LSASFYFIFEDGRRNRKQSRETNKKKHEKRDKKKKPKGGRGKEECLLSVNGERESQPKKNRRHFL